MHLSCADFFRAAIFAAAHVFAGSLGAGIVAVSLGVRLALLPLTIRLARRALAQQAILARLQPELQRLQARYRNDPAARMQRIQALYRREGLRLFDPVAVLGGLVQLPVLAGVYAAVRQGLGAASSFLWISNLLRSDVWLARDRSEEHTSELQSRRDLVCRLLLEKKKQPQTVVRIAGMLVRRV